MILRWPGPLEHTEVVHDADDDNPHLRSSWCYGLVMNAHRMGLRSARFAIPEVPYGDQHGLLREPGSTSARCYRWGTKERMKTLRRHMRGER